MSLLSFSYFSPSHCPSDTLRSAKRPPSCSRCPGVLKDILLVILSVLIWSTPVTQLQVFGYSIALAGLVYYKMTPVQDKPKSSNADNDKSEKSGIIRSNKKVRFI